MPRLSKRMSREKRSEPFAEAAVVRSVVPEHVEVGDRAGRRRRGRSGRRRRPGRRCGRRRLPRTELASAHGTETRTDLAARRAAVGAALDEDALDPHVARRRLEAHRHAGAHLPGSRARPARRSRSRAVPSSRASVIAAVPPGCTRASFVWTCVCVPSTAVTLPSSQFASATFSLVASACMSTTITGVRCAPRRRARRRPRTTLTAVSRKSEPSRLITATSVPSCRRDERQPLPGRAAEKFAGRITRSLSRQVRHDLAAAPRVVAERDRVDAGREHPVARASA